MRTCSVNKSERIVSSCSRASNSSANPPRNRVRAPEGIDSRRQASSGNQRILLGIARLLAGASSSASLRLILGIARRAIPRLISPAHTPSTDFPAIRCSAPTSSTDSAPAMRCKLNISLRKNSKASYLLSLFYACNVFDEMCMQCVLMFCCYFVWFLLMPRENKKKWCPLEWIPSSESSESVVIAIVDELVLDELSAEIEMLKEALVRARC